MDTLFETMLSLQIDVQEDLLSKRKQRLDKVNSVIDRIFAKDPEQAEEVKVLAKQMLNEACAETIVSQTASSGAPLTKGAIKSCMNRMLSQIKAYCQDDEVVLFEKAIEFLDWAAFSELQERVLARAVKGAVHK
jgi:uncharacterized protein (DUF111 family)